MTALGIALALVLVGFQGGLLSLKTTWNRHVQEQLQLDGCAAKAAIRLGATFDALDRNARAMDALRASIAADLFPTLAAGRRAALEALGLVQTTLFTGIQLQRAGWVVAPCPSLRVATAGVPIEVPYALPSPPEDFFGARPIQRNASLHKKPVVVVVRRLALSLEGYGQALLKEEPSRWRAYWIAEPQSLRASAP